MIIVFIFKNRNFMKLKLVNNLFRVNHIKLIFKTNNILLFTHNVNNNILKQKKYWKTLKLKVFTLKTFLLAKICKISIKNLWFYSFIKNSILTLFYYTIKNKTLNKVALFYSYNKIQLFSIKLNNKIYVLQIVKNIYSLNYYFNIQLIYKFLNYGLKKFNRNNVN